MTDAQWIHQWFRNYADRIIPKDEKSAALAQIELDACKDGSDPNGPRCRNTQAELKDFVRRHNEQITAKNAGVSGVSLEVK